MDKAPAPKGDLGFIVDTKLYECPSSILDKVKAEKSRKIAIRAVING